MYVALCICLCTTYSPPANCQRPFEMLHEKNIMEISCCYNNHLHSSPLNVCLCSSHRASASPAIPSNINSAGDPCQINCFEIVFGLFAFSKRIDRLPTRNDDGPNNGGCYPSTKHFQKRRGMSNDWNSSRTFINSACVHDWRILNNLANIWEIILKGNQYNVIAVLHHQMKLCC